VQAESLALRNALRFLLPAIKTNQNLNKRKEE